MEGNLHKEDEKLVIGLKDGRRDAFEKIFRRYWYRVYKAVFAQIKSHEDAEEIVQDLFSALWDKRNILVIPDLSNYLLAAARKRVLNYFRSGKVREKYKEYYLQLNAFVENSISATVESNELNQLVEQIVEQLPKKTQEIFRLNRFEGYSIGEIAEKLNVPKRTIGYHLTKSLKELQLHLKDFLCL